MHRVSGTGKEDWSAVREMTNHNIIIIISRQLLHTKAFELSIFLTYIY